MAELPAGWVSACIKDLGEVRKSRGGPKADEVDYGAPVIRYGELYTRHDDVVREFHSFIPEERAADYTPLRMGDVLFAGSGETLEEIGKSAVFLGPEPAYGSGDMLIFRPNGQLDPLYVGYASNGPEVARQKSRLGQGSSVMHLYAHHLEELELPVPPRPEQKAIAEILSSVDEAIAATRKVIEQTERVKKGFLQTLMTRGIGHTRFKKTEIGEIPEGWEMVGLGRLVERVFVEQRLIDEDGYRPVVIRRRHGGVEAPVEKSGASILVKKQFKAVPGLFAISKRQIIHGACGIVPTDIPSNATVSKEYLQLRSKGRLQLAFLDLYSRTPGFFRTIERCTYGVDREKFVLNERWFFKEMVPLPPEDEQLKIINTFDRIDRVAEWEQANLSSLLTLKRGLLQDLLTGRVRVPLD